MEDIRLSFSTMKQTLMETERIKTFTIPQEEKERLIEIIKDLLAREEKILLAFLYGSFLEDGPFRDIDVGIVVEEEPPHPALYEFQLENEMEKALGTEIPLDLRIINHAPVTFLYHVIKGRLLVCRDSDFFAHYVTLIARKYLDLKPRLDHYTKEAYGDAD